MLMNIETFEDAFDIGVGSCRAECDCGKEFYCPDFGADWDEGELDHLEKIGATSLDCSVSYVVFEGTQYVMQCECWHERAKKIMGFLDDHNYQIAKYINKEKQRLIDEANRMPTIGI